VTISVMTPRVLVLWDSDRTLIDAGGVDKQAWPEVCAELTGRPARQPDGSSGRTGPRILLAILTGTGVGQRRARELLPAALRREAGMLAARRDRLREQGRALPGLAQTVVTGNIRPSAELKLATFGLDGHIDFPAGAYGSDHADRRPAVAGRSRSAPGRPRLGRRDALRRPRRALARAGGGDRDAQRRGTAARAAPARHGPLRPPPRRRDTTS
jgi:hypothetical protein